MTLRTSHRDPSHPKRQCQICGKSDPSALRRASIVRSAIVEIIMTDLDHWDPYGWICLDDLQKYQFRYVQSLLKAEKGELTELENEVIEGLRLHELLTKNPELEFQTRRSFGDWLADRVAAFGGSWYFIVLFAVILFAWMFINSYALAVRPFDPYPYILLNLVLSSLAALQAPIIMMSQNRQEARDRLRAMSDYKINLKAELEIRQLHQKVDHLLSGQWDRLAEIQQIQMDLIEELRRKK